MVKSMDLIMPIPNSFLLLIPTTKTDVDRLEEYAVSPWFVERSMVALVSCKVSDSRVTKECVHEARFRVALDCTCSNGSLGKSCAVE